MSTSAVRVHDLHLRRGTRQILSGVSFDAAPGEVVALVGVSGSGKTTILRCLAGLEQPDAGTITVDRVGMVFQFHALFEHLSALDNVTLAPLHVTRTARADAEARARTLLEQLGVAHRATALPRELSGGEAQRVAIARALAMDPPMLLMDEPTASLDATRRDELAATLRELAAAGRTLVLTSHDEHFVVAVGARVVHLKDGRVVG